MFNWSICCRKLFKSLKNRAEIKLSGARQQFQIAFEHSFTTKNLQIIFGKFVVNNSFIIINKIFTQTKLYFLLTKNLEQFPTLIEFNLFNWLIKLINIFYILSPFKQRCKAKQSQFTWLTKENPFLRQFLDFPLIHYFHTRLRRIISAKFNISPNFIRNYGLFYNLQVILQQKVRKGKIYKSKCYSNNNWMNFALPSWYYFIIIIFDGKKSLKTKTTIREAIKISSFFNWNSLQKL